MSRLLIAPLLCAVVASGCVERVEPNGQPISGTKTSFEDVTVGGVEMISLTGGTFQMGSSSASADESSAHEGPVHAVTVSPFMMDKYEVTQDQYAKLQLPNPAHFKGERHPVEQVRWSDAALFCNERSRAEGLAPCYDEVTFECDFDANGYRLPTEAEWEFAARAGSTAGAGTDIKLGQRACYSANSSKQTQAVGQLRPNAWGFCDMQGNVSEWCNDIYSPNYYAESNATDPRGPAEGEQRVLRGGNWKSGADECRLTARIADDPGISDACFTRDTFGFRCVRKPIETASQQ